MPNKPVALVTGANQGIGLQIAKDLAGHGFTLLVGSRNMVRGEVAAQEVGFDAHAVQLDVTDRVSVRGAAERIRHEFGRLDVLIQNAAISNTTKQHQQSAADYARATRPSIVSRDEMHAVWNTNVFGVLAVYQAMLPLLRETPGSRIVNVSSPTGSLTRNADPATRRPSFGPVYAASKTALNALTIAMAIELEAEGIPVNAVAPGHAKTNLNGYAGTEPVEQGAREAVRVALLGRNGPTAQFTCWENEPVPF